MLYYNNTAEILQAMNFMEIIKAFETSDKKVRFYFEESTQKHYAFMMDLARLLMLPNNSQNVSNKIWKEYRFKFPTGTVGASGWWVNEYGINQMIFASDHPNAVDIQRWVFEEVLPAIRRDGAYVAPDITQPQAIAVKEKLDRILDTPDPWKAMYTKEFCDRVFGWFGAQFYWDFCYYFLTVEERCKLNSVRSKTDKIHQYLEPVTRDRLTPRIHELNALVGSSRTKESFLVAYQNLYGRGWQGELEF
jgi:prophage antirepressor-like protein